jgi:hypothetical protein
MTLAEGFDRALKRAGIPIVGVSIGDPLDRSTWMVTYAPEATFQHQAAGDELRLSYVFETDTAIVDEEALDAFDGQRMLKALGIATAQRLGVPLGTFRNEVIAAYKALPR